MQIQNVSNNGFKGGFKFQNISKEIKKEIPQISNKGRQIFNNFPNENDVFLVLRDEFDYKALKFIKKHNLKFAYYPLINTKCGLDSECPEGLAAILEKTNSKPETDLNELGKRIKSQRNNKPYFGSDWNNISTDKVLQALCIDPENKTENIVKNIKVIKDKEFSRKIMITQPEVNTKIHYVMVVPDSPNQEIEKYAIDNNGKIRKVFKTPDDMKEFRKLFNSSIK